MILNTQNPRVESNNDEEYWSEWVEIFRNLTQLRLELVGNILLTDLNIALNMAAKTARFNASKKG